MLRVFATLESDARVVLRFERWRNTPAIRLALAGASDYTPPLGLEED